MRTVVGHAVAVTWWSIVSVAAVSAGDGLKAGWTKEALASATADCTEALVQGSWENTKREQGVDPSKPLTDEIRKQLAPEIAGMKKLCACAVREAAKHYTRAEAEADPADLERVASESITKGTCKLAPSP